MELKLSHLQKQEPSAHTFSFTIFPNKFATHRLEETLTLDALELAICSTLAPDKSRLPWIKLALFGDNKTEKNCLRHDANVTAITGVEIDYDAGQISFNEACDTIQRAGLLALLYTTASHLQPGKGARWRILLPTSAPLKPERRAELVARVNGLFGGAISNESFPLSTAFYFGGISGADENFFVESFAGHFIDQRDDLKSRAVGRGKQTSNIVEFRKTSGESHTPEEIEADLERLRAQRWDNGWHETIRTAAASYMARGMDYDEARNRLAPFCDGGANDPDMIELLDSAHRKFHPEIKAARERAMPQALRRLNPDLEAASESISERLNADLEFAKLYQWVDPDKVPAREFLYGRRLARGFVSATVAPGGTGKTSLVIAEALSMVSGKSLLNVRPPSCLRVWLWCLEDSRDELTRRIQATAKYYGLTGVDLGDRLRMNIGNEQPLMIANKSKDGSTILMVPVIERIVQEIKRLAIDVLIVDPFIGSHDVPENDNSAINDVAKAWAQIADSGCCAIELVHHARKGEKEITTESARGGGAFSDACRMVRVVNRMSETQGQKLGIANHRLYFRTYIDKNNTAPPADASDWYTLVSEALGQGDHIGVVTPWDYPDAETLYKTMDFNSVISAIKGGNWRADMRSPDWIGRPIARALNMDLDTNGNMMRVKELIKYWLREQCLVEVERDTPQRKKKIFVEVSPLILS